MKEQIDGLDCKNCLHHFACLVNSEYVPTPCPAYGDKEDYRKQEWISVDDRLPEKEGVYLVHTTYNIIETEVFYISKHDDISYWWDLDGMVTHWMPLPEPPKMKGGAE